MHREGSRDMGNMSKKDKQLLLSLTCGIQVKHTRMTLKQKEDCLRRGRGQQETGETRGVQYGLSSIRTCHNEMSFYQ